MKTVAILGGGIAGMSAAHELVERGFKVEIYELKEIPGGKARSIKVPKSPGSGLPLPGEHGFRFFPGFYKHVTDMMKRIPYRKRRVFDNLVPTKRLMLARLGKNTEGEDLLFIPVRFPRNCWDLIEDIHAIIKALLQGAIDGLNDGELEFFVRRVYQLLTSSKKRCMEEYEKISWWDYLEADNDRSQTYINLLVRGISISLVASRPELASTKTIGDAAFLPLLLGIVNPDYISTDLILNGPTNDVWFDPWLDYLEGQGVNYHKSHRVSRIIAEDIDGTMQITGVEIVDMSVTEKSTETVKADYYIAALPVEIMAGLISGPENENLLKGDPTLENLKRLGTSTAWMSGMQFYLKRDVQVGPGHVLYVDSPWALTSVSQQGFWPDFPMSVFGDGEVNGIISAIPSNWGYFIDPNTGEVGALNTANGIKHKKPAQICSETEIKEEVWEQMKKALKKDGQFLLQDEDLHFFFLDPNIVHNCAEMQDEGELQKVLDRDLPKYFKELFLWIHARESVTLEEIAAHLNIDQNQARLAVNALIAKGFVGPIPLPNPSYEPGIQKSRFNFFKYEFSGSQIEIYGLPDPKFQVSDKNKISSSASKPQFSEQKLSYYSRVREKKGNINSEPFLVNLVNTWVLRPEAYTRIPNLFLASDYVRTNTDIATMEAANEAARRAVNGIVDDMNSSTSILHFWRKKKYCKIWDRHRLIAFTLHRWADEIRYQKGLPWNGKLPWYFKPLFPLVLLLQIIEFWLSVIAFRISWLWAKIKGLCPWLH